MGVYWSYLACLTVGCLLFEFYLRYCLFTLNCLYIVFGLVLVIYLVGFCDCFYLVGLDLVVRLLGYVYYVCFRVCWVVDCLCLLLNLSFWFVIRRACYRWFLVDYFDSLCRY